jgi:hypothetical protein
VYRKGFNAELKGSINTAVNAYTSPEIGYPFNESIPETKPYLFILHNKKILTVTHISKQKFKKKTKDNSLKIY